MNPQDLGLPAKFTEWRASQLDAIYHVGSGPRFTALAMPTGSGKSVVSVALGKLLGGRTAILTSTKGLQDQLALEFGDMVADMRGKSNYLCDLEAPKKVPVPEAICQLGMPCALKAAGCNYYESYRKAMAAPIVVTNYAFWLSSYEYSEGLGGFDTLVLDEAHNAPDELSDFLTVSVAGWEFDAYLDRKRPPKDPQEWPFWAFGCQAKVESELLELKREIERTKKRSRAQMQRIKDLVSLKNRLERVIKLNPDSVVYRQDGVYGDCMWSPVHVEAYNHILFRGINKVVFISATMRPKTLDMLGAKGYAFHEYPSVFPAKRRPVVWVPTTKVQHSMSALDKRLWLDRIDQIIGRNLDRKGIIHTVSYERRDFILKNSKYAALMFTHARKDAPKVVKDFKRAQAPAVLVSPSMGTGWDFPGTECEYQIIGKVPFPDASDPLTQARTEADKDYGLYMAMVELVQASGRGMRAKTDQCQTIVIDDNISWFMWKARKYAPKWFLEGYQESAVVPSPLVLDRA